MASIVITIEYKDDESKVIATESGFIQANEPISTGVTQWVMEKICVVRSRALTFKKDFPNEH